MKIAIIGNGKMGQAIAQQATDKGHQIILTITSQNRDSLTVDQLKQADVIFETTRPDSAFANLMFALNADVPVICGTTGWLDQLPEVQAYCQQRKGAFLHAANFSVGVNILFELNSLLAKFMDDQPTYTITLNDEHHAQKLDRPSGTAAQLLRVIISNVKRIKQWAFDPQGPDTAYVTVKREGHIPGTHAITWTSPDDSIQISHQAHNRNGFAQGAVKAAEWIVGKQGCFTMKDVLFAENTVKS